MTVVRMFDHISGGRWDGRDWPPANGTIDVPKWEAEGLIAGRLAVAVGGSDAGDDLSAAPASSGAEAPVAPEPVTGAPPAPAPVAPPEVSPVTEVSAVAEVAARPSDAEVAEHVLRPPEITEPTEPEPPAPQDVKARWVEWAILQGEDPGVAPNMTKADLMSKYGGRL